MKGAIKTNFRGMRALVVQRDDPNRRALVGVLGKLGLEVEMVEPGAEWGAGHCDLVFFDADEGEGRLPEGVNNLPLPYIALIGSEAPSRLGQVVRLECASHIVKPVRHAGVFTALLLAVNAHERWKKTQRRIDLLEQRMAGRRLVIKAVLHLMALCKIDDETAYENLRQEAMNRRVSVEQIARERLGMDGAAPPEGRRRCLGQ